MVHAKFSISLSRNALMPNTTSGDASLSSDTNDAASSLVGDRDCSRAASARSSAARGASTLGRAACAGMRPSSLSVHAPHSSSPPSPHDTAPRAPEAQHGAGVAACPPPAVVAGAAGDVDRDVVRGERDAERGRRPRAATVSAAMLPSTASTRRARRSCRSPKSVCSLATRADSESIADCVTRVEVAAVMTARFAVLMACSSTATRSAIAAISFAFCAIIACISSSAACHHLSFSTSSPPVDRSNVRRRGSTRRSAGRSARAVAGAAAAATGRRRNA